MGRKAIERVTCEEHTRKEVTQKTQMWEVYEDMQSKTQRAFYQST